MVHRACMHGCTNECHKTCNSWYSGMMVLISSIIGILILISKNLSDSFYGGLSTASASFYAVLHVNNSLSHCAIAAAWPCDSCYRES